MGPIPSLGRCELGAFVGGAGPTVPWGPCFARRLCDRLQPTRPAAAALCHGLVISFKDWLKALRPGDQLDGSAQSCMHATTSCSTCHPLSSRTQHQVYKQSLPGNIPLLASSPLYLCISGGGSGGKMAPVSLSNNPLRHSTAQNQETLLVVERAPPPTSPVA